MIVSHAPLVDQDVLTTISDFFSNIRDVDVDLDNWDNQIYFSAFDNWIKNSHYNKFTGIDLFPYRAYGAGTIDGIQSFIHRHGMSKRIRFSRAEFVGSKIVCNHASFNWAFLEDGPISDNDAVVLSFPFSGNGNLYENCDQLLDYCDKLNVPVLIDAAYFGISHGITIDLSRPCITDVVFSLSKPFSTQLRLGYRITKQLFDDVLQLNSDSKIYNRYAVSAGIKLLNKFSHDWLIEKYHPIQQKICKEFNLTPSATVTLASDNLSRPEFFRNGYYRVCITHELQQQV